MAGPAILLSLIMVLGIIASQTQTRVLYISIATWLLAAIALGAPLATYLIRVKRTKYDKRLEGFTKSWLFRAHAAWGRMIATNLAYCEGTPKRWYHYMSDMMEKYI
jgi:hypothetical protein